MQQHWNRYDCLHEHVWVHKELSGSTPTGLLKLVRILEDGFRRIWEYSSPLEDVRTRQVYGRASAINKILIVNGEMIPGRITVVLVKQHVGFYISCSLTEL